MVELQNIKKSFGSVDVLKGVNLKISPGKVVAILGPNGSGKTTMIKSILGMVLPDDGKVYLNGKQISNNGLYRKEINYLPQIARFPDNLKVREIIDMVKDIRSEPSQEDELIKLFGLESYLNKKLGNLSGGTRQKVNIVLTFMFEGNLVVLDEPTAGLDPVSLIHLKEIIERERKKEKTFLITTHILPLVEELADEIVFLLEGKIHFNGTLNELKKQTKEDNLEKAIATILKNND